MSVVQQQTSLAARVRGHGVVVALVGFVTAYAVPSILFASFAGPDFGQDTDRYVGALVGSLLAAAVALAAYRFLLAGLLERRRPTELRFAPTLLVGGALTAALVLAGTVLAVAVGGGVGGSAHGLWPYLAGALAFGIKGGVVEELFFRGLLFRLPERYLGTWLALALSAVIFGVAHVGTPGATWWTTISLVSTAGIALALAYVASGSLWLPIGLHFGWNFAQATLGVPVSGNTVVGPLATELSGPEWLTGGGYGPEASVVTVLLWLGISALLLRHALRHDRIVAPAWARRG